MAAIVSFIRRFLTTSSEHQLSVHAAALAYYAVFSIFPLSLLLISSISLLLPDHLFRALLDAFATLLPRLADLILAQVDQIVAARNTFSVIGALGLLYGASGYFSGLSLAIHRVFDGDLRRPVWLQRGLGILLVTLFAALLLAGVFLVFLIGTLAQMSIVPPLVAGLLRTRASGVIAYAGGGLGIFLLYRYTPRRRPTLRSALAGALLTTLAIAALSKGFSWYLSSRVASFSIIYGSISTVIALILFLYFVNLVIVHGAAFTALLSKPDR